MTHAEARAVLKDVWSSVTGREPSLPELQYAQAVGMLESHYGDGWVHAKSPLGAGAGSNNWGAVQCKHGPPSVPGECFETTDHHPDGRPYQWCYRIYATPQDGAAGMLKLLTVARPTTWKAMQAGDTYGASYALYGYYGGKGSKDKAVSDHAKLCYHNAKQIAASLGEPLALTSPPSAYGSAGVGVAVVLGLVGLAYYLLRNRRS